ncbi:MAG: hypothetical protein Q4A31_12125 [Corynebacterium sp.]|uniref:hypothetical protein n=1 Tax=Corynebacterium sp. TaxID=1720 RepID=UPI0026DBBE1F|nr:hypothetical protein [Corynebacterium sp.]MDO4762659.1 hypothetical protein [Corynebacterium sp.]
MTEITKLHQWNYKAVNNFVDIVEIGGIIAGQGGCELSTDFKTAGQVPVEFFSFFSTTVD